MKKPYMTGTLSLNKKSEWLRQLTCIGQSKKKQKKLSGALSLSLSGLKIFFFRPDMIFALRHLPIPLNTCHIKKKFTRTVYNNHTNQHLWRQEEQILKTFTFKAWLSYYTWAAETQVSLLRLCKGWKCWHQEVPPSPQFTQEHSFRRPWKRWGPLEEMWWC